MKESKRSQLSNDICLSRDREEGQENTQEDGFGKRGDKYRGPKDGSLLRMYKGPGCVGIKGHSGYSGVSTEREAVRSEVTPLSYPVALRALNPRR